MVVIAVAMLTVSFIAFPIVGTVAASKGNFGFSSQVAQKYTR